MTGQKPGHTIRGFAKRVGEGVRNSLMRYGSCKVSERFQGKTNFPCGWHFGSKKTILRNHLKGELDGTKLRSQRFQFPDMITSMHQVSQQLYIAYIEWLWIFQRHGNCAWWTVGFAHMPPFWALSCIGLFLSFVWRSYSSYIVQNVFVNAPRFKEFLHAVKIQFIFCIIIFFLLRRYWDPWICVMNNIGSIHPTQNIPVINTF